MKTPQEILDLQVQNIARSKTALAKVTEESIIRWNAMRLVENALMAWLISRRNGLDFEQSELSVALDQMESYSERIIEQPGVNYTYYYLSCMILKRQPKRIILDADKRSSRDLEKIIDSSVVPFIYYKVIEPGELLEYIKDSSDTRRALSYAASKQYINIMSRDSEPSESELKELQSMFRQRKKDNFYSESRIYGGGPDNDIVCDVEYAAIAIAKGFNEYVLPAANK